MKSKNFKLGFTLIELLAVIVILAIIALIATPMILKVVEKSKIGSYENGVLGYVESVNQASILQLENTYPEGTYFISDTIFKEVKYKGKGPDEGILLIQKGNVTRGEFCIGGYSILYENSKATYQKDGNYCSKNYNYEVTLNVLGNSYKKEIGIHNKTSFEVDQTNASSFQNISCNKGAVPSYENGIVTISNITDSTLCKITSSLNDVVTNVDTTYISILNDETIHDILISKNQKLTIDINGKHLIAENSYLIKNQGNLTIIDSKKSGSIVAKNAQTIASADGSDTILRNVTIISDTYEALSEITQTGTEKYNVTIEDSHLASQRAGIQFYSNGNLVINNSKVTGIDGVGIANVYDGKVIITNSIIQNIGTGTQQVLLNQRAGTIEVTNSYINGNGYGINNQNNGNIIVNGNEAILDENGNYISGMYLYTPKSHYIYNTSSGNIYFNGGTVNSLNGLWTSQGTIYFNGGTIRTHNGTVGFGSTSQGIIYINDGNFGGEFVNLGTGVRSTGKTYICGGNFKAVNNISSTGQNSYFYYKSSGINWNNEMNKPTITGTYASNVIQDDNIVCK